MTSTLKELSIAVSITTVGLILTKLGRFQYFDTNRNSISTFFEKKIKLHIGFSCCSTREVLSIDLSFTTTTTYEARVISILGVRTDREAPSVL